MTHQAELPIEGMTCASCANRIERKLNDLDGVTASVNFATERATVTFDPAHATHDELVSAVNAAGYQVKTADHDHGDVPGVRARAVVSALLSLPILLLSMIPALQFSYWQWVSLVLATPVVTWAGWPFHRATITNLRHRAVTMDTLISMGTVAAYGWSLWALFLGGAGGNDMKMSWSFTLERSHHAPEVYFEVAAVVTTFLLIGKYIEARAKKRSGAALTALAELGAKEVTVLDLNGERTIPIAQLTVGRRFIARPGEKIATDGVVVDGRSATDNSMITGESTPVDVGPGDSVIGSTINTSGRLVIEARKVGDQTALAAITRLVTQAQSGKAPVQRLADRISAVFVPVVIALAAATLVYWLAVGEDATFALSAAVAVLIVACPCALGLATPTALLVGTGRGAQLGVLIHGPEVLEDARRIDTVVLDKTGTLTTGKLQVAAVATMPSVTKDEALRYAAAVERASEHPVARAIAASVDNPPAVDEFVNHAGLGVEGTVGGVPVLVGKKALMDARSIPVPEHVMTSVEAEHQHGRTTVLVAWGGKVQAGISLTDTIKPTSADAVRRLRTLGLNAILLTGDNEATARDVATEVGIERVIADVMPADKLAMIEKLQGEGHVVAMVGDGVNDAAALTQADLGIAMGTGTDVAIASSDLTLVGDDVRATADAIRLSRKTLTTIKTNLVWAFGYNIAAIPLAAAGYLNPMIAGVAMAASSVLVVTNSLRLLRVRL
jgi:Cu+-exporting ATPase